MRTVSIPSILSKRVSVYLAPALDHNDVITKGCFDKRRKDGLVHGRWLEGERSILKWALHSHYIRRGLLNCWINKKARTTIDLRVIQPRLPPACEKTVEYDIPTK